MKKKLATVALALLCAACLYAQKPQGYVRISPPRQFFYTLTSTMRKIYPDPKSEMMLALSLAMLGYPNFPGVSDRSSVGFCVFEDGDVITAAIMADNDSPLSKFLDNVREKPLRDGGWLLVPLYTSAAGADISAYAAPSIETAQNRDIRFAYAEVEAELVMALVRKYFDAEFSSELLDDFDRARISIDVSETDITIKARAFADDDSKLEKALNSFGRRRYVPEAAFVPQNAPFTVISSVNTSAHNMQIAEKLFGAYFGKAWSAQNAKLAEKSEGTFAITEGDKDGRLQSLTVAATKMDFDELKEYFAAQFKDIETFEIDGTPAISMGKNSYFAAIANGFAAFSDSRELLAESVVKIKSAAADADYPLKKYAKYDADFVLVINNSALLNRILNTFGMELDNTDFAEETALIGKIGRDSIEVSMRVEISTLRAYADIVRKVNELKAKRQWQKPSQQ